MTAFAFFKRENYGGDRVIEVAVNVDQVVSVNPNGPDSTTLVMNGEQYSIQVQGKFQDVMLHLRHAVEDANRSLRSIDQALCKMAEEMS